MRKLTHNKFAQTYKFKRVNAPEQWVQNNTKGSALCAEEISSSINSKRDSKPNRPINGGTGNFEKPVRNTNINLRLTGIF